MTTKVPTKVSKEEARFTSYFIMKTFFSPFQTHLWAFDTTTLGPLAQDLTPVAGTELAARAVPHVTVVTHRALVQAASLGSGAFVTAPTRTLHFGPTLRGSSTARLSSGLFGFHVPTIWMTAMKESKLSCDTRQGRCQGASKSAVFLFLFLLREIRR